MSLLLLFGGQPALAGPQTYLLTVDDNLLFDDQPDLLRIPLAPRQDSTALITPANRNRSHRRGAWLGTVPIFRHPDAAAAAAPQIFTLTLDDFLLFDEAFVKSQQATIPDPALITDALTKGLSTVNAETILSTDDFVKTLYDVNADALDVTDALTTFRTATVLAAETILSTDEFTKTQVDTNDDSLDLSDAADATGLFARTTAFARITPANQFAGRHGAWLGTVPLSRTLLPTVAPPITGQTFTLTVDDFLLFDESFVQNRNLEQADPALLDDGLNKTIGSSIPDNVAATDASSKTLSTTLADNILSTDGIANLIGKTLSDDILVTDTASAIAAQFLTINDNLLFSETLAKSQQATQQDPVDAADALTKTLSSAIAETVEASDTFQGDVTTPIATRATAFARISTLNPYTRRRGAWLGTVPVSRTLLPIASVGQLFTLQCDDDLISTDTTVCLQARVIADDDDTDFSDSVTTIRAGRLLTQIAADTADFSDASDQNTFQARRTAFARILPANRYGSNASRLTRNRSRGGAWLGTVPISRTLLPLAPTGTLNSLTVDDFLLFTDTVSTSEVLGLSLDDFILFYETLAKTQQAVPGDSILFSEALVYALTQLFADLLVFSDTVQADRLTGVTVIATDFADFADGFYKTIGAVPGDGVISTDEFIKAIQSTIAERAELSDSISANKVAGVSASDTLLLVTDLFVKQLQTTRADDNDFSDALAILLKRVIDDSTLSDDQFVKELLMRLDFDRAVLSDSVIVSRILAALLQDNLVLRDEMTRNLGVVLGDDFANTETLVKIINRIVLDNERWTDDIVASVEIAVVHIAEYLAKTAVGINSPPRAEVGAAAMGGAHNPEVGARRKASAAPIGDDPKPKVGTRQKVRK